MRILVMGDGAREHALYRKLSESSGIDHIYGTFRNIGMTLLNKVKSLPPYAIDDLPNIIQTHHIDYAVIGPENILASGATDILIKHGVPTIGPTQKASQLESSKSFFKRFASQHGIPQPDYQIFYSQQEAWEGILHHDYPLVLKKNELCFGKGSVVCYTQQDAERCLADWYRTKRTQPILIEKFILGEELSITALVHNKQYCLLPSATDYKKQWDGHLGMNTGGMGAYSIGQPLYDEYGTLIQQLLSGLIEEHIDFCGFLYLGLMIERDTQQAYVLECNVRLGDPETQVLLPRLSSDLHHLFENILSEYHTQQIPLWCPEAAASVVLTRPSYPSAVAYEPFLINDVLERLANIPHTYFYSSSCTTDGKAYAHGGRLLSLTTLNKTVELARQDLYHHLKESLDSLEYPIHYRQDIASGMP